MQRARLNFKRALLADLNHPRKYSQSATTWYFYLWGVLVNLSRMSVEHCEILSIDFINEIFAAAAADRQLYEDHDEVYRMHITYLAQMIPDGFDVLRLAGVDRAGLHHQLLMNPHLTAAQVIYLCQICSLESRRKRLLAMHWRHFATARAAGYEPQHPCRHKLSFMIRTISWYPREILDHLHDGDIRLAAGNLIYGGWTAAEVRQREIYNADVRMLPDATTADIQQFGLMCGIDRDLSRNVMYSIVNETPFALLLDEYYEFGDVLRELADRGILHYAIAQLVTRRLSFTHLSLRRLHALHDLVVDSGLLMPRTLTDALPHRATTSCRPSGEQLYAIEKYTSTRELRPEDHAYEYYQWSQRHISAADVFALIVFMCDDLLCCGEDGQSASNSQPQEDCEGFPAVPDVA